MRKPAMWGPRGLQLGLVGQPASPAASPARSGSFLAVGPTSTSPARSESCPSLFRWLRQAGQVGIAKNLTALGAVHLRVAYASSSARCASNSPGSAGSVGSARSPGKRPAGLRQPSRRPDARPLAEPCLPPPMAPGLAHKRALRRRPFGGASQYQDSSGWPLQSSHVCFKD
eukprot:11148761-Alexandrium_andersonii.AAC.1